MANKTRRAPQETASTALQPTEESTKAANALMVRIKGEVAKALPKNCGLTPDRFARIALTELRPNPKLLLDEGALMGAIMEAAQMGLVIGGAMQRCWLVPYKGKAKLMMGFQGLGELAYRSGRVLALDADVVREKDHFMFKQTEQKVVFDHEKWLRKEPGEMYAVWARATLTSKITRAIVLTEDDVLRAKQSAKGIHYSNGAINPDSPWNKHPGEMWKKTAVRNLCKLLPMLTEDATFSRALEVDNDAYDMHAPVDVSKLPSANPPGKPSENGGVSTAKDLVMGKGKRAPKAAPAADDPPPPQEPAQAESDQEMPQEESGPTCEFCHSVLAEAGMYHGKCKTPGCQAEGRKVKL